MNFKIKHIDNVQGTIEIDWLNGITLIHSIPLYILENPDLSQERMIQELEYMRPPIPEPIEVPGALLDLVEVPEPEPEPEPEPSYPQFTALELLALFTEDEQLAVVQASMTNAVVKLWYDRLIAATYVTYQDPRIEGGLQALVDGGLLTQERKVEIVQRMLPEELRTPVEDTLPEEPEEPESEEEETEEEGEE